MYAGRVVADGPTIELLADETLLAANRLELPYGMTLAAETHLLTNRSTT